MTRDDYLAWRDHPMTQWVMRALEVSALGCEAAWLGASWDGGKADPILLTELRAKAHTFRAIAESEFEDLEARNGEHERD